jgi:hypothetical protein
LNVKAGYKPRKSATQHSGTSYNVTEKMLHQPVQPTGNFYPLDTYCPSKLYHDNLQHICGAEDNTEEQVNNKRR